MSLGTNISRLRAEKRLSQGDLAEVLEVSRQSVSKWETDSSVPDLDKLIKLSQLFRVTLDELVTGAEPQLKVETPPVMVSPSMPGRKIAGIILFCMAFLAFLIPTVLGGILVGLILAVPFLVCGIICFLVRKRPGLWCAWAAYLAVYIFLCQVGTKKILRIYKPFIGGQPPVNGLHFSLCSFAVLCATLLIRRLERLHHWSDRKLVVRLGQILEPDAVLPELSLKPYERGSVPANP